VVTSPPYNVGVAYDCWDDSLPDDSYHHLAVGASKLIGDLLARLALEMQTTKIAPVKARFATLLGSDAGVASFVGRLYGVRSALVHGDSDEATTEQVQQVELLARSLLKDHMNQSPSTAELEQLRRWTRASRP
jgi:hypothetical protein